MVEVAAVVAAFFWLRLLLRGTSFSAWQVEVFGGVPLSSAMLFFALPLGALLTGRRNPGGYGLTTGQPASQLMTGVWAAGMILPATILFPLLGLLQLDPIASWPGGFILAAGFSACGVLVIRRLAKNASLPARDTPAGGVLIYVALLGGGLALEALFQPFAPILSRLVAVLIFVAFLEEFFFRGYLQSRLNDVFGRPYQLAGLRFGPGLILAAILFGLLHPLTSPGEPPWPWALWTGAMGAVFGFVREKTDTIVAPALTHGILLLPMVLFSP
jgi:membrane protease YdiL (CAAX protease family)